MIFFLKILIIYLRIQEIDKEKYKINFNKFLINKLILFIFSTGAKLLEGIFSCFFF